MLTEGAGITSRSEGWKVVAAAFFGVMVSFGSMLVFTFSVFLKPLNAEFGWSRESISAAFGVAAIMVAACSPVLGRLLDRYGPRPVILPCMAIFGFAFLSLSRLTPSIYHLYFVFFVMGVVGNGTTQMSYSRAVATWFDERRGTALSLVVAGTGVGSIVFPVLAQNIISDGGWRQAYLVLGTLILLFGLPLTALFVRERPMEEARGVMPGMTVAQGVRSPAFWLLIATLFLSSVSVNAAITHLSAVLSDRGVPPEQAAWSVSALGVMSLAGRLMTGPLLDRFFGPRVSFGLLAGATAGMALLSQASSVWMGIAGAALIGFGVGGEADVTPYLLIRYFGLKPFSTLYGLTWTAYAIAGALGPVLMGKVFDATGSYAALLSILAAFTMAAGLFALLLPAYPVHSPER